MSNGPNSWITPAAVASLTGRHVVTVRQALECGELHGHQRKFKGRWLVSEPSVEAWIQNRDSKSACGCIAS